MKIESNPLSRSVRLTLMVLAVLSVAFPRTQARAGSLVIPAWSFARGNAKIHVDPNEFADAGPVVGGGEKKPWGWTVEYDIDIPVTASYTIQICYAAAEARPVELFFDGKRLGNWCTSVTFASQPAGRTDKPTWKSSGARWEATNRTGKFVPVSRREPVSKGKHTLRFVSRTGVPHLVAFRLDTPAEFPPDWKPPRYKVRDIDNIPAKHRKVFSSPGGVNIAAAPLTELPAGGKWSGSIEIPAWTFDRGNANIYASPDKYADTAPLAGGGPAEPGEASVEYDINFPVTGEYTLQIRYASDKARPVDVFLNARNLGKSCTGVTIGTSPIVQPTRLTSISRFAKWEALYDYSKGTLLKLSVSKGKHTLKLSRRGGLPNLSAVRFDTRAAFPKGWVLPERKVRFMDRVPAPQRAAFLPANAVNIAALRLAIGDTIKTFGPRYPGGPEYLKQLSAIETKQSVLDETGSPEDMQQMSDASLELRSRAMLAHPMLDFDKLLFIRRPVTGYNHTYAVQRTMTMGSSLCVLSPVSPDGKVTSLVPEFDGGLFDRFDLSFDAKKVIFGYRTAPKKPFRIHEIDIDPAAGKMVPGSLRQLTFGGAEEAEVMSRQICGSKRGFDDLHPCYLPSGKIMFASSRAQRIVFCSPDTATTLYIMDADGKNVRRLSESPISETLPSVMNDGRVLYTRWEYVDKGLGNAETLWAMHPDGTVSDHVYKLNTVWPAGMSSARSIPGSRRIVAVAGNHYYPGTGAVVLVDTRRTRRGAEAMHCITPEIGYPPTYSMPAKFGVFTDPYPFSEKFFLASHAPGPKLKQYGIYVLDAWGNRTEVYRDPAMSCFEPIPLRRRPKPTEVAAVEKHPAKKMGQTGTLFIQNVYSGMTGIQRGRVKYVRVMGALEWPWDQHGISWSLGTDPHRKKIYGLAKVHQDGSVFFTAPADQNLLFQALDENYMALQQMSTFINLMPGENRSCVGCHERRKKAPSLAGARPTALKHPPQTLTFQPGDTGVRVVDFVTDVQRTIDKHCLGCHSGKNAKGNLDLDGTPVGKFSRSYDNLTRNGLINYRACQSGSAHIEAVPPLTHGAIVSKLIEQIGKDPCKSKITRTELIKIATWIDANVPYYGTYRGKRDLRDKDHPDFRLPPLVAK
ncbi:MAG: hypothetical protein QGH60_13955 [Phycisphaerae bacterium]|jgi:hypothetical protein|nr:hypothetical protein [Phycisphaerae bacterium]